MGLEVLLGIKEGLKEMMVASALIFIFSLSVGILFFKSLARFLEMAIHNKITGKNP